jgi:hypothetical protein
VFVSARRPERREGESGNWGPDSGYSLIYTLIKKDTILLIYKEIQNRAVAKSYLTNGLLIYGEIFAYFLIYGEIFAHFLIYGEIFAHFLIY